ncbi:MAG: endolytic transglycosylase MltG [Candidatus Zixiibacteriota bacterium]
MSRRNRKKMSLKTVIIFAALLIVVVAAYTYRAYTRTIDIGDRVVTVVIKPGDTLSRIARQLVDKGVVESKAMLVYPARLMNLDRKLTPGRYDFTGENSCRSVLARLEAADFLKVKLTIPEGATKWKVASIVAEKLGLDSTTFMALDKDSAFLAAHELPGLEGYLFPETYFIPWGVDEAYVANEMIDMFHRQTDTIWPENIIDGHSRYDIVKLASIVEAETGIKDERRLVASVYHNRLRKRMKLDADPTVIYGLGGLDRPLWTKDLRKDSPYNTYMRRGLPPTPINSPGLASLRAALNPEQTDYYYFVADETGGHYFSKTNAEHNRAKEKIKAALKEKSSGSN